MPKVCADPVEMSNSPINFVLGIGAQKAGTTWLHHFLSLHPETEMGPVKEYHVWDTFFLFEDERRQARIRHRLSRLKQKTQPGRTVSGGSEVSTVLEQLRCSQLLMENPDQYPGYFVGLAQSRKGVKAVGDITPAYALLDSRAHSHIRTVLEACGFVVKPVFILRDPVSRVISAYDMYLRRWQPRPDRSGPTEPVSLEEFAAWPSVRERTDYRQTVRALEQAFGVDRIFLGLFETFFTRQSIHRLLEFVGISWAEAPTGQALNKSRTGFSESSQQRRMLREIYADTYDYCSQRFPDWDLEQVWSPHSDS